VQNHDRLHTPCIPSTKNLDQQAPCAVDSGKDA
jgi:hypothetical protein